MEPPARAQAPTPARRRLLRAAEAWAQAICAAGGGVVALLAAARVLAPLGAAVALRVARNPGSATRLQATAAFVLATACVALGVAVAMGASRALAWWEKRGGKPRGGSMPLAVVALVLVAALGALRARWLGWGAPLAVLALAPWMAGGDARAVPARWREPRALAACLACEGACLGVGVWFRYSEISPALLFPAAIAPAALALYLGATRVQGDRWPLATACLPMLALPLAGLARNPTLLPAAACVVAAAAGVALLRRFPEAAVSRRLVGWARRHALVVAIAAIVLVPVLPWRFRDANAADLAGHEGQHLGWINSMSFGKLMMADAGFTYGPVREYTLGLLAWLQGGLTLEHVRLAHVAVNVAGLLFLLAAMKRVCAGRLHLLALGGALLLTHSVLVSFLVYRSTYAFGWADASRAGLAVLAVVTVLTRRLENARGARQRLVAGGALAALATLYSHDFGLPAVAGTLAGLGLEVLRRDGRPLRRRALDALRDAGRFAIGFALVAGPFLAVYAARGKLGAFFDGYRWASSISRATGPNPGRAWWLEQSHFASWTALTAKSDADATVGARVIDYVVGPGLVMVGVAHVVAAVVRGRLSQRSVVVAGLTIVGAMTAHHAFIAADPWHVANASTPSLVMLVALAAGSRGLSLRPQRPAPAVPLGAVAALAIPLVWLSTGAHDPLNDRFARVASGDERPSFGAPYKYDDLPRAGDVHVGDDHLAVVRWIRAHTQRRDPVLCATWLLGGGTEAFLSERRNPTSFDKPDEVASPELQARALAELKREPPELVVGSHLDEFGDEVRAFISAGWQSAPASSNPPGNPPIVVLKR